ncbi:hypothetical protein NDK43_27005 [Neobacillus pocheonensis]|uniref:Uncharacterized protein n=1 Tax=Neobacillus pocheonensis TaxID=363869 RepID=A0ABT0WIG2_9BACI|nr:hypothetical protein [Neobacillus pocheonensis]
MKKSVLIIVLIVAFLSLISCSNQSKASSNTAFTFTNYPDYAEAASSVYKMYQAASVVMVGKFEKDNTSFVHHDLIETESHMKVTKVLKGALTDSEMKNGIDIVYYGGDVTLDTYLKNTTPVPEES